MDDHKSPHPSPQSPSIDQYPCSPVSDDGFTSKSNSLQLTLSAESLSNNDDDRVDVSFRMESSDGPDSMSETDLTDPGLGPPGTGLGYSRSPDNTDEDLSDVALDYWESKKAQRPKDWVKGHWQQCIQRSMSLYCDAVSSTNIRKILHNEVQHQSQMV
ncbi:hypothetical protein BDFG_02161 [Blastomyces dermatitidis ATCC 26199]|nr:hypothetical protein BDFG_02161 [Blastomyces dermatitidis ATCC 26199]